MSDEFEYEEGVFTDNQAIETLRKSAEALGINPDLVAPEDGGGTKYFARKNCKHCFGLGTMDICLSPSKMKFHWKNQSPPGRFTKRKGLQRKPSQQRQKVVFGLSPGNELDVQWNPEGARHNPAHDAKIKKLLGKVPSRDNRATEAPEPFGYKKANMTKSFCRCVRAKQD